MNPQTIALMENAMSIAGALDKDLAHVLLLTNRALPADIVRDLDASPKRSDLPAGVADYAAAVVMSLALSVFISEKLATETVDRAPLHATRNGVGERRVDALTKNKIVPAIQIAESAIGIGSLAIAEGWTHAAREGLSAEPAVLQRNSPDG